MPVLDICTNCKNTSDRLRVGGKEAIMDADPIDRAFNWASKPILEATKGSAGGYTARDCSSLYMCF